MSDQVEILVVDDDTQHLAMVKRVLRRSNYKVTTADGPGAALRIVSIGRFDLLLVDVMMPTMSGQAFLRRFRRLEQQRFGFDPMFIPTPAIFVSGMSRPNDRVHGLDAGAVDYIVKPFDAQELRARIRGHLRQVSEQKRLASAVALSSAAGQIALTQTKLN